MIKVKNHQTPPTMRPERDLGTERRVKQEGCHGPEGAALSCRPIIYLGVYLPKAMFSNHFQGSQSCVPVFNLLFKVSV